MPKVSSYTAITGADTAADDIFYIADTSAGTTGSRKITRDELAAALQSDGMMAKSDLGWGTYNDTTYTTGSRLTIADGVTTALPNNKGSTLETYKPSDITTFYDGTVITGIEGEGRLITIDMKLEPQSGANYVDVWFDIGGAVGELYRRTQSFPKGAGAEFSYISTTAVYTLDTWESNGATIYVEASGGSVEIWDIRYVIHRTSKV